MVYLTRWVKESLAGDEHVGVLDKQTEPATALERLASDRAWRTCAIPTAGRLSRKVMRYPDGGGLSVVGRARPEMVRLQAVQMFEQDVSPVLIARWLRGHCQVGVSVAAALARGR
jgi:hypothetical protein